MWSRGAWANGWWTVRHWFDVCNDYWCPKWLAGTEILWACNIGTVSINQLENVMRYLDVSSWGALKKQCEERRWFNVCAKHPPDFPPSWSEINHSDKLCKKNVTLIIENTIIAVLRRASLIWILLTMGLKWLFGELRELNRTFVNWKTILFLDKKWAVVVQLMSSAQMREALVRTSWRWSSSDVF